jgi:predicted NUDIX family NTP pyrophosphohydrolase
VSGRRSAGLLLHRRGADGGTQVLLGHMGGPFFARREAGAWTIPKGEYEADEEPWAAALREFREELGPTSIPPTRCPEPLGWRGRAARAGSRSSPSWTASPGCRSTGPPR